MPSMATPSCRVIIWAIPILGLLGTVIGITSVFANLDIKHFDASLPQVLEGLQVAFDTTGLALAMSMLLMFGQTFVDRFQTAVLSEIDRSGQCRAGRPLCHQWRRRSANGRRAADD